MHDYRYLILVCTGLVAMAGVIALLLLKRRQFRHFVLRKVGREMSSKQGRNEKRMRAHRATHDKAEAALFALVKVRDQFRNLEEITDNAAEHVAAITRGE